MSDQATSDWPDATTDEVAPGPEDDPPPLVAGLVVLAHPDPSRVGDTVALRELHVGRPVALSRLEPLFAPASAADPGQGAPRPLADTHLSRQPLWIEPASGRGCLRLSSAEPPSGGRLRVVVDGEPLGSPRDLSEAHVARGVVLLLAERVALLLHRLDGTGAVADPELGMVGESAALLQLQRSLRRIARLDMPVLIEGETGCGKELVASAIHRTCARNGGPFVAVNVASIPAELAAAELFGATRGAFTGADRERPGFFSRADGGTLFLDEVGDTPAPVQALLLRALETGEIQPVGSSCPRRVDVRVLAATDADLEKATARGTFRAPLLHRLSGTVLRVPPLRERREDVGRLLVHFLRQELEGCGRPGRLAASGRHERPWLPASLVARLASLPWPGNVRQLRNVARHLVAAYRDAEAIPGRPGADPQLERLLVPAAGEPAAGRRPAAIRGPAGRARHRQPSQVAEEELIETLRRHRWRLKPAAVELGISRTSLYALVDRSPRLRRAGDLDRRTIEKALDRAAGALDVAVEQLEVSRPALLQRMRELGIQ